MRDLEWSMSEAAASMASSSLLAGDGRRSLARDMTRCPTARGAGARREHLAHMVPDSSKSTSRETSGDGTHTLVLGHGGVEFGSAKPWHKGSVRARQGPGQPSWHNKKQRTPTLNADQLVTVPHACG